MITKELMIDDLAEMLKGNRKYTPGEENAKLYGILFRVDSRGIFFLSGGIWRRSGVPCYLLTRIDLPEPEADKVRKIKMIPHMANGWHDLVNVDYYIKGRRFVGD